MALVVDTTAAFYRIREHTKGELVSIGSDGNILRWADRDELGQQWLFIPLGERTYRIMTRHNGEYMAVVGDGNIRRWAYADDGSQEFRLVNESDSTGDDGTGDVVNIQVGTSNDYVAVGSYGNILRWVETGKDDQRFTLEPVSKPPRPALPELEAEPGQIGDIPRLTSYDPTELPERSEAKVVGATHLLATVVNDPSYGNKVKQMEDNPYYVLVRRQFWSRAGQHGYSYEHPGRQRATYTENVVYEVATRSGSSSEETWGYKFSISGEIKATDNTDGVEVTASAGMAAEISHQLKVRITDEKEVTQRQEHSKEVVYLENEPRFTIVGWSLVDQYTIYKADQQPFTADQRPISETEISLANTLRNDVYPPKSAVGNETTRNV